MEFELYRKKVTTEVGLMTTKINDTFLINKLKEIIDNNIKKELCYATNVKGEMTDFHLFTEHPLFASFIKSIKKPLKIFYGKPFEVVDAWGNILNKGDKVVSHNHRGTTAFSGILYLTEDGPGTYFPQIDMWVKEEIGKVIIFEPTLLHQVDELEDRDPKRYTIAFNANEISAWNKAIENHTEITL